MTAAVVAHALVRPMPRVIEGSFLIPHKLQHVFHDTLEYTRTRPIKTHIFSSIHHPTHPPTLHSVCHWSRSYQRRNRRRSSNQKINQINK